MKGDQEVRQRAEAVGIAGEWADFRGEPHAVSIESLRALLATVGDAQGNESEPPPLITARAGAEFDLPADARGTARITLTLEGQEQSRALETRARGRAMRARAPDQPGYHRVSLGKRSFTLAVAPARRAVTVKRQERGWGLSVQLPSLYRPGDGGIGTYAALRDFVRSAADAGAATVVVSPLHAQFSADGGRFSPYAPSSRLWRNVLHIDAGEVAAELGLPAPKLAPRLGTGRDGLINWAESSRAKLKALRALYDTVRARQLLEGGTPIARSFGAFRRQGGQSLLRHALFEALHAHFYGHDRKLWHWHDWPAGFQNPQGRAARQFAGENEGEVGFHMFLQWLAAREFRSAADAARDSGMSIGIITDLAVGADGGGSEAWSNQGKMLQGVSIGAPPDEFNTLGQSWGVTTFSPRALVDTGFAAFIALLRATLRDAGGLRIDHVLGLRRLWVVPDGADPGQGAYLQYPLEDLLRLTALEAERAGALVVGEDLWTVPEGFRDELGGFGIRGMQVLWFQRGPRGFLRAERWSPDAVGMTTTHDLPTVAGWWLGRDIAWRHRLKLFAARNGAAVAAAERKRERLALWDTFVRAGVAKGPPPGHAKTGQVVNAAIAFLGRAASNLVVLPLEDALGRKQQPNLPGTVTEHPNWRQRVLIPAGKICGRGVVAARLRQLKAAREAR